MEKKQIGMITPTAKMVPDVTPVAKGITGYGSGAIAPAEEFQDSGYDDVREVGINNTEDVIVNQNKHGSAPKRSIRKVTASGTLKRATIDQSETISK